ncbi:TnsA endonuclease N-terminal domain-containing protein [Paraburkholderia bannensis]|uniref:TnsA endonuclease N-terminal domain-containing protein n=1 Tax=Paraburkholderia bannensis TaxID=765414 RepID=UPI001FDED5A4|nr:TnsA endonuclease N-terminal domain-containing protein [Paraburkholderia bannensis]
MPEIIETLVIHSSPRRSRRIVTVSGLGVRGKFPSRKSVKPAEFESLIEEMTLRFLEVAPSVKSIATQPQVFEYSDGKCRRRYTPDVAIKTTNGTAFLEVKDDASIASHSPATARLRAATRYLRQRGERFHLVLRSDLIANDLQDRLQLLLSVRPMRGRYRTNIDATLWDPENETHPSEELQQQWKSAKRECDALLQRIMKRDPDDLLPISPR